jgi:hypothetical protein
MTTEELTLENKKLTMQIQSFESRIAKINNHLQHLENKISILENKQLLNTYHDPIKDIGHPIPIKFREPIGPFFGTNDEPFITPSFR